MCVQSCISITCDMIDKICRRVVTGSDALYKIGENRGLNLVS